jgi:hypothetical protein
MEESMLEKLFLWSATAATIVLSAMGAAAQDSCIGIEGDTPEIAALYVDNFAGWHSVGGEAWLDFANGDQLIFHVCSIDNNKNFLVAQNDPGNDYNPLKFSRFEWYGSNGTLYYCQQVFDAASAVDAADLNKTPPADTTDANDKGCGAGGKSPWSQLILIRR